MVDPDILYFKRLDFVASSYSEVGGLRVVPVGVFALSMALILGTGVEFSPLWEGVMGVVAVLAVVISFWFLSFWYRNNYGMTLESWPGTSREVKRWMVAWTGAGAMVAVGAGDFGPVVGFLGYLAGTSVLVWILVYWRRSGKMWPQGISLMSMLMLGSLLSHVPYPVMDHDHLAWLLVLFGATLLCVGITDHLRLAGEAKTLDDNDG